MSAFACYRLPRADRLTWVWQREGAPLELPGPSGLDGRQGFVLAPFSGSASCPLLLLRADETGDLTLDEAASWPQAQEVSRLCARNSVPGPGGTAADPADGRDGYAASFARFHGELAAGRFSKMVLSRCAEEPAVPGQTAYGLFLRACRLYPRMFVALVTAPRSGTWLMATPEVLLEREGELWHTVALAGTMRLEGPHLAFDNPDRQMVQDIRWSQKNIQEQRCVATYLGSVLKGLSVEAAEEGPCTVRAANLVHLRSDFRFCLPATLGLGTLLDHLHPTPAVCGLPKEAARQFILHTEPHCRRYYSGFCGPLDLQGSTRLYVSLRCMELLEQGCRLYAGGGLMPDSSEQQEWEETEAKMETMRQLLRPPFPQTEP